MFLSVSCISVNGYVCVCICKGKKGSVTIPVVLCVSMSVCIFHAFCVTSWESVNLGWLSCLYERARLNHTPSRYAPPAIRRIEIDAFRLRHLGGCLVWGMGPVRSGWVRFAFSIPWGRGQTYPFYFDWIQVAMGNPFLSLTTANLNLFFISKGRRCYLSIVLTSPSSSQPLSHMVLKCLIVFFPLKHRLPFKLFLNTS